jgi:hypothetical protein
MRYRSSPLRLNCRWMTNELLAELPSEAQAEALWVAGRGARPLSKPLVAEHCLARVGAFRRSGDDVVDGVFVDLTVRQFDRSGPALVVYDSLAELATTWAAYFANDMDRPRCLRLD